MSAYKMRSVLIAYAIAAMLSMPAASEACWLCGRSPCATAQTTYTPPYYASYAPTYAAPAGGCSSYAPQVAQYAPYATYRPAFSLRPVTTYYYPSAAYYPTTAYYPSASYNTCAMPVTAYRPVVAYTQQVRMIPYSTYRMAYMPATYIGYAPTYSTCASPCATPCSSCESVSYEGATYESSSCQPAISSTYAAPSSSATIISSAPSTQPASPKTFQEQNPAVEETKPSLPSNNTYPSNTPATDPELKPIPSSGTQLNPSAEPRLIDPDNRTTSAPVRHAIHLVARPAAPVQSAPVQNTGGWRESRD